MDTFNILVIYEKYIFCQYNFKMTLLTYTCTVTQNASAIFNSPPMLYYKQNVAVQNS